MVSDGSEKIEGLIIPRKLIFGDEEQIKLRNRIAERKRIREEGIICPCGETRLKHPIVDEEKDCLKWQCGCGWSGEIAKMYKLSTVHVGNIKDRKSWRHI